MLANSTGHGGYRKPEHPAPVSGPGKYARRTDGHPAQVLSAAPDQDYGEQTQQLDAQRVAPMGGQAPTPTPSIAGAGSQPEAPQQMPTFSGLPLSAPSQRPDEPITTGVDIGPGAGSEALNLPSPAQGTGQMTALLSKYAVNDSSGLLGQLMQKAAARNA